MSHNSPSDDSPQGDLFPDGPPAWPFKDPAILNALVETFESGAWGKYQGDAIPLLQSKLSAMHRSRWVHCCSSGTIAVELALRSLALSQGDRVLLAAYDFPGNFAAIEAVGAVPVLIDVRRETWTVDAKHFRDACVEFSPKAAIVSHLHGGLAPMREIMTIAKEHDVRVVEDFCQCPGAWVDGEIAGTWGDLSVLSFGGSKLLSAGRGGAVLGTDSIHQQRIRIYNDQGNERYPLSELQAAVLLPQLATLVEQNEHRQAQAEKLIAGIAEISSLTPVDTSRTSERAPAYYKLAFRCDDADRWVARLRSQGVAADRGFRGFVRRKRRCLAASELDGAQSVADSTMILHHPILADTDEQIERLIKAFVISH